MSHHLMFIFAVLVFLFFIYAALVSFGEKERLAVRRFMLLALTVPLPFLFLGFFVDGIVWSWMIVLGLLVLAGILFMPRPFRMRKEHIVPRGQIDERDTMF